MSEHDDMTGGEGAAAERIAPKKGNGMELLVMAAVLVAWVVLQAFVLPKFGVST